MLGNAQLLGKDRPVTLGLGQQDQKIRVVQNVGNGRACQQVFHILREGAGDAALFAEHLPNRHKVAGGELVPQQDMELVKVAPCSDPGLVVGVHRRRDKLIGGVHGDLAEVFAQPFEDDTHHPGIEVDIGGVVEQVEGAGAVELQRRCHTAGLRLRLFQKLLVQILQQRGLGRFQPQRHFPVHQPHTAVNHGFLNGLQALPSAHDQLAQGQQKIRLHGKRTFIVVGVHLQIHRRNVVGAVRGDVDDLPAQPLHQRGVFAHRVYHDDPVISGKEHIDQLPFSGKALAGARGTEVHPVG